MEREHSVGLQQSSTGIVHQVESPQHREDLQCASCIHLELLFVKQQQVISVSESVSESVSQYQNYEDVLGLCFM